MTNEHETIQLQAPAAEDGMAVFKLIESCPPLDTNSSYCNLLQCSHFAATSVAAKLDREVVGFISGYLIPERPDTLFIWQVAVGEKARGQGMAGKMILHLLERDASRHVKYIETTITPDNQASWALFKGAARKLNADITDTIGFDRDRHFNGQHETEMLVRIGPF